MLAAFYERLGSAHEVFQITDVPTPAPGPGDVRIRLAWSGVNPSDVKSRRGGVSTSPPFPRIIPHSDGSGTIDAVGAGVPESRIGERVWTWNAAWGRAFGTAAEYVVLPAAQAVPLPNDVDLAVGACLGIPALTAYHAVATDGGVVGKRVLVAGGAGAVGHYVIQLSKLLGARQVVATVSGAEKGALAKAAGADVIVNYRTEDLVEQVRAATNGELVDRIIEVDYAANAGVDHQLLHAEGEVIVYGSGRPEIAVPFGPMIRKNLGVRFFIVYNLPSAVRSRAIVHLTAMLERGSLSHNIAARLPLEQIADAHELVEQGRAMGNAVLEIGG